MPAAKDEVKPKSTDQNQPQSKEEDEGSSSSATGSDSKSGSSETLSSSGSSGQKEVKGEERKQTTDRAKNLESVSLNLRNGRRLYVDLRENEQGKFINMAVVSGPVTFFRGAQGPVPRIAMPLEVAKQFLDFLGQIGPKLKTTQTSAAKTKQAAADEKGAQQGGRSRGPAIDSATLTAGKDREYQISLLPSLFEGREPVLQIVSILNKSGRRTMNIESGEIAQLKKALNKVLRRADGQAGDDGDGEKSEEGDKEPAKRVLPERQSVVFGNKRFYFDPFVSARGQSIKISNVYFRGSQVCKDSIVVPDKVLADFAKILSDYDAEMNSSDSKEEDSHSSAPSVSSSSAASSTEGVKKDA